VKNSFGLILFITYWLLVSNCTAQVTQQWVARYNGPSNGRDYIFDMAIDNSNNIYVTGYSLGDSLNYDWATIKYNSNGDSVWVKRYFPAGNISDDWAYSICLDRQMTGQYVYVTGYRYTSAQTFIDYVTIKYNQNGDTLWTAAYTGSGAQDDKAYAVAVDNQGNVYVTGTSMGSGSAYDYLTVKYNASGVEQWTQRYNGPANNYDYGHAIAVDESGNVYVTGWSWGTSSFADCATIKYNTNGVQQWVQRYNGTGNGNEQSIAIKVDGSGNVYIAGNSAGNGSNADAILIKYNSAGVQQWVQRYNGAGNNYDAAMSVALDPRPNNPFAYITGNTYTNSSQLNDCFTIKYTSGGDSQWVRLYDGGVNQRDYGNSITVDTLGSVYVTGRGPVLSSDDDIVTLKYNEQGAFQWRITYDGPGQGADNGQVICLDKQNNIIVGGWSYGVNTGQADYVLIKYSQTVGVTPVSSKIPQKFYLYQNYPNPFNPNTKIKFDIPPSKGARGMTTRLGIYDILGREVTVLVNEQLKPGTYETQWDGSNYPSGVYFYQLSAGDYIETRKMLLIK
jgi:uncharacterized delta-60 repeat protein